MTPVDIAAVSSPAVWPVRVPGDGERVEQVLPTLSPRLFLLITTAANDHSSLQFYKDFVINFASQYAALAPYRKLSDLLFVTSD